MDGTLKKQYLTLINKRLKIQVSLTNKINNQIKSKLVPQNPTNSRQIRRKRRSYRKNYNLVHLQLLNKKNGKNPLKKHSQIKTKMLPQTTKLQQQEAGIFEKLFQKQNKQK